MEAQNNAKIKSRKSINVGGPGAEVSEVRARQDLRNQQEKEKNDRRAIRAVRIAFNKAKRAHHQARIDARQAEQE